MKTKGLDGTMHDAWYIEKDGTVHAYHLQQGDKMLPLGHISSDDLINWRHHKSILPPLTDDSIPDDYYEKWTGCTFSLPDKEGYAIYYTMLAKDHNQSIGMAVTNDLETVSEYNGKPVLKPDPKLFLARENIEKYPGAIVDCRDMLVVYLEEEELYYGYFAASAHCIRECPVGVVAAARSKDMINWEDQSIVFVPEQNGVIEVPDVFFLEDKWYLTFLSGANYAGRAVCSDDYVNSCTMYAVSESPLGPFVAGNGNILIGGTAMSGYSCRSVELDSKRYVLHVDRAFGGNQVSLPKELKVSNGKLRAMYTPLLEKLRSKPLAPDELKLIPNSFAWQTYGGAFTKTADGFSAKTNDCDYQAGIFSQSAKALEMDVAIKVNAFGAGIVLRGCAGGKNLLHFISVEPQKQRIILLKGHLFEYLCAREYPFISGHEYRLRVIAVDGVLEVYVNDELLIQHGAEMTGEEQAGLFCDRGTAEFTGINLYDLEIKNFNY